ncbi:topoisomerase DNA-binding C4 zinc finger domain-containing protein [Clostridium estertheticum]|nr:topoisomerase DNA-binding C4 zinc finger domain-containing protein [Clostridium estertheticum]MBU3217457.1 topoisomerase DNA-binding C4 zinc finger domain-containing protein [Clostridium estertheticum]WAG57896.1 topoisomerase DNA-binding C4 zinc finger domain-containing protein [Clostridium estertheticum]
MKVNSDFCPKCGGELVLKNGRYGQFKGGGNFPICRFISK